MTQALPNGGPENESNSQPYSTLVRDATPTPSNSPPQKARVRRPKRRGGNHRRMRSLYRLPTWQEDPELEAKEEKEEDGARPKPNACSQSVPLPSPAPTTKALPTTTQAPRETTSEPDQNGCRKEAAARNPRTGGMLKPALHSSLAQPGQKGDKKKKRVSWKLD